MRETPGPQINDDRNLRLQCLASMRLNLLPFDTIYSEMLGYRRFPEQLFVRADE